MNSRTAFHPLCFILCAVGSTLPGQDIEISPHRKPHTQDATVGYQATQLEKRQQTALKPDFGKPAGFSTTEADSLLGKTGQQVAWFGIVREIKPEGKGAVLLLEHKY